MWNPKVNLRTERHQRSALNPSSVNWIYTWSLIESTYVSRRIIPWHFKSNVAKEASCFPPPNNAPEPGKICVCKCTFMQIRHSSLSTHPASKRGLDTAVLASMLCSKIPCNTKCDWFIRDNELSGTNQNLCDIWWSPSNSREILIVLMSALGFDADFLIFPPFQDSLYFYTSTEIRRRRSKGCCNRGRVKKRYPLGDPCQCNLGECQSECKLQSKMLRGPRKRLNWQK